MTHENRSLGRKTVIFQALYNSMWVGYFRYDAEHQQRQATNQWNHNNLDHRMRWPEKEHKFPIILLDQKPK